MLSLGGGTMGMLLGVLAILVIGRMLSWPMQISPLGVLAAALFSTAVGVVFGYYPARRASRLNPIDALRYE